MEKPEVAPAPTRRGAHRTHGTSTCCKPSARQGKTFGCALHVAREQQRRGCTAQQETKAAVRSMGSCWTVNGLKALKREALARVVAVAKSASVCVNMTTTEQRKIDSVVVVYLRVLNKGTAVQTEEGIRPPRNLEEVKRWRITPCAVEVAVRSFRWLQTALRHLEAHQQAISTVRGSKGKEADAVFSRNDQLLETAHIATRFQEDVEGYRNISGCETFFELWDECRTDWKLFISIPPKKVSRTCGGSGNAQDSTDTNKETRVLTTQRREMRRRKGAKRLRSDQLNKTFTLQKRHQSKASFMAIDTHV